MEIKNYLKDKTNMNIELFYDKPPVKSYIGSENGENKLFIKCFDIKRHFNKELTVLTLLEREIIFTDEIDGKFILIVPFYPILLYKTLGDIDDELIKETARAIAKVHNIKPPEDYYSPSLYELLDEYYSVTSEQFKEEIKDIYDFFENKKEAIKKEELTLDKKLLCGSFMNDSFGFVDGEITIFNFEYSLVQTPWYEFILGYHSRLGLGHFADTFLTEYRSNTTLQEISRDLTFFLILITLCKVEAFYSIDRLTGVSDTLISTTKANLLNKLQLYVL